MVKHLILAFVTVLATLATAGAAMAAEPPSGPAYSGIAVKTITGTLRDGAGIEIGAVQLSQDANGVVQVLVSGAKLSQGLHGIHIHSVGICEGPAFTSAGSHFNPAAKKHGLLSPDGHHNGDLHNLEVAANGTYSYTSTTKDVSITTGANSVFDADGSAVVVHMAADDHVTDPTGNSGARIACAVIAEANPALATPTAAPTAAATATRSATAAATTPAPTPKPPSTGNGVTQDTGMSSLARVLGVALLLGTAATATMRRFRRD
ncbi:hypothetical protein AYO38_03695 [bacterium SCGC AG-212-C10]|nr:hypothetical protein AYO38_03695 [bacterium SCGC AG-212-C10]